MTTAEFITHLHSLDIKLWADGDHLRCSAPKTVLTSTLQAELRDRKAEILAFLQATSAATGVTAPPLQPVSRDGYLPLSFAQRRLWFLDQLEPGRPSYNVPAVFHLRGRLKLEALERSFNEIVGRHEILRTTFAVKEGQPVQVIAAEQTLGLTVIDLRHLLGAAQQAESHRLATEEAQRPFDLSRGPLVRVTLLRLAEEEHVLALVLHHIVSDGWSMGILYRELSAFYEALLAGKLSRLAQPALQYADYAVWQRNWFQGEALRKSLSYWKDQLAGAPQRFKFPTDHPRSGAQASRGKKVSLRVPALLTDSLKSLARSEQATLFITLLAAFQTLLYRYSGETDIVVGTPVAGRNRSEIEGLQGPFVNTLVLRTDLSGNPNFLQLMTRVRDRALAAFAHQDLPFEKLVEELRPQRGADHRPLFQVLFNLVEHNDAQLQLRGLTVEPLEIDTGAAKFDLSLNVLEKAEQLVLTLSYDAGLFEHATIERMLRHFHRLLEGIAADPSRSISEFSLLTDQEQQQLLVQWNNTRTDYPKDRCIHEIFEQQVERTPDAIAVMFEDQQVTYRELNTKANQLARHLRELGVGPETLVAICIERSMEMLVGVLGILKAGGAYVPLDPTSPKQRLVSLLEASRASLLLTQHRVAERLPRHGARIVCLDTDWRIIAPQNEQNLSRGSTPDNLAYVIYTSGSTGQPRGVMIQQRSILNLLTGLHQDIYTNLDRSQLRVSLNGPLAFDTSVKQLIQLLHGHTLHILPEEIRGDGDALVSYLRGSELDVFDCTPSQLRLLISAGWLTQEGTTPAQVLVGGEPIDSSTWRDLIHGPGTDFYNVYGPTECTVDATVCRLQIALKKPNIGRPIANTQVYLLDAHLEPVPIGVPGELHIGGVGLARGYLNQPEPTAEKFIPNPFSDEQGARLYKTGDLARYLPGGSIEFLGRADHQVKIRGFRIELGEIEAGLMEHPEVQETVVIVREDGSDDKQLVAYVVCNRHSVASSHDLRRFLKQKLPGYMIPTAVVCLESLPLTPNGKVDRGALPTPDGNGPESDEVFVAPRTLVEKTLAGIWAEVLKLKRIGIHDDFFDLGGHSLLATRIISRVRETFHVEMFLRTLFEKPTLAGCARVIADMKNGRAEHSSVPAISPIPRQLQRLKLP